MTSPEAAFSTSRFQCGWRQFATVWRQLESQQVGAGAAAVERLLDIGLSAWLEKAGSVGGPPLTIEEDVRCQVAVIRAAGLVSAHDYLAANPDVDAAGMDPTDHFARYGWHEIRNPSLDFDLWWYWAEYLNPQDESLNPALHFAVQGRHAGLDPLPSVRWRQSPRTLSADSPVRRVCLFAGYDRDGVIDDYVVAYLRELSRYADVYYLADCVLGAGELDKLQGIAQGAWAIRHGAYDFGSYSMLAQELVGWEVIEGYDELLLVNDSCYLLRPLDEIFATMDITACDWWGLQATAHPFRDRPGEPSHLEIAEAIDRFTPLGMMRTNDFLHVGSYFLAYRQPVIRDEGFRRRLNSVTAQRTKSGVINKYEVGFTRYLVTVGYHFCTFVTIVPHYHPVYSAAYFALVERGYPLLKRQFLSDNPYDAPDLVEWKERVLELVPDAPVEMFERNLLRTAPDDRLQRSFAITTQPDGTIKVPQLLTSEEFALEDERTPTFDHWWAFPVCAYDHTFAGNERAVFESVRDDPSIKKIVLTRSRRVELDGDNVVVVPLASPEGQHHLLRSGQIFVKHAPRINVPYPLSPERHNFINLWHGIPLKRFGYATVQPPAQRESLIRHHQMCRAVITSSHIDTLAMASAFYPLSYDHMWPTGLPRNDFVLASSDQLPEDLRAEEVRLRELAQGRRLVLFVPTFKDGQADAYYQFDDHEIDWLTAWCERNNAVIGVREHMADTAHTYGSMLARTGALNLSSTHFPNVEVLYRVAAALITDYSSCLVDFLLTGRPVVSFAYDLERYITEERGLFYDLDHVIPGPIARDFAQLVTALDHLFDPLTKAGHERYVERRQRFFDHIDTDNTQRLINRVKDLYR